MRYSYPIIGYVYVPVDSGSRSVYRVRIKIKPRPKPSDNAYADTVDYISITKVLEECQKSANDVVQVAKEVHSVADQISVINDASGTVITMSDASDGPLHGLRIYGKTTQDGTPTPDAPVEIQSVGSSGAVNADVLGKNLISMLKPLRDSNRNLLLSLTDNEAHFSGSITGVWKVVSFYYYMPAGTYTVSAKMYTDIGYTNLSIYQSNSLYGKYTYRLSLTKDGQETFVLETPTYIELRLHLTGETSSGGEIWTTRYYDIMLEKGSTATAYEPYQGNRVTVQTPNGLPGIPVASGGNYTDSTGQQWICDEVDFARGVYVKRVRSLSLAIADMNNGESYPGWKNVEYLNSDIPGVVTNSRTIPFVANFSSEKYSFAINTSSGNSILYLPASDLYGTTQTEWKEKYPDLVVNIIYAIASGQIETALSADELAAYAALHTYTPTTNISNGAGAWMDVEYVADTKLYIDKKFDELANAIVSLGGNM